MIHSAAYDPAAAWWWPWVTGVAIPSLSAIGTVSVAIVAVWLAQKNTRIEHELCARARRVQFAARLRASVSPQILRAGLGTWLVTEFDPGNALGLLADEADAPQTGELLAWSMMLLASIDPADSQTPESAVSQLVANNRIFDDLIEAWIGDPRTAIDFAVLQKSRG